MGFRRIRQKQSEEKLVAQGTLLREIPGDILSPDPIEKGRKVKIARIIRTPAGLSFRIMGTTRWIRQEDLDIKFESKQVFDYTGTHPEEAVPESWTTAQKNTAQKRSAQNNLAEKKRASNPAVQKFVEKKSNEFKAVSNKGQKDHNTANNECKSRIRFVTNKHRPIAGKIKGTISMDKQVLRTVLTGLTPDERLTIAFLGDKESLSGEYTVIRTKKGRGKGGSQLVELRAENGDLVITGTPDSEFILHMVTADGTLHGHETPSDVPPVFETDAATALSLKESFKSLVDLCELLPKVHERDTRSRFKPTAPVTLFVESTHEPINGTLALTGLELKRGRYGKIVLTADRDGEVVVLDSFQHSGVITSFKYESVTDSAEA